MIDKNRLKERQLRAKHRRVRQKVFGTPGRPRLCVHRSLKNFEAQIIDDADGKVLVGMSTLAKEIRDKSPYGGNCGAATALGEALAAAAAGKGITKVCFDRGGYIYHGRVRAFAEAARKGGLEF